MISLKDVTVENVRILKRINDSVLPVIHNEKFYMDLVKNGAIAKLACYNEVECGAVCCRVLHDMNRGDTDGDVHKQLYIVTLACLTPYRRLGIGSAMLEEILRICRSDGSYHSICLHVQTSNTEAIAFYEKYGFKIVKTCDNYYARIEPSTAYVLQLTFSDTRPITV